MIVLKLTGIQKNIFGVLFLMKILFIYFINMYVIDKVAAESKSGKELSSPDPMDPADPGGDGDGEEPERQQWSNPIGNSLR